MSIASKELTRSLLRPTPPREGALAGLPSGLRRALADAMHRLKESRWQIAGRVSELLGREVSKPMLDAYCAESHEAHRLPADVAVAVSVVTGSHDLLGVLAQAAGCVFVPLAEVQASDASEDLRDGLLSCAKELGDCSGVLQRALKDRKMSRTELLALKREVADLIRAACAMQARIEEAV